MPLSMSEATSTGGRPGLDPISQWVPALVAPVATVASLAFRPDDLFIYLRMVRNILLGSGWGFNPGEAVNAASSAAWLFVLLVLGKLGGVSVFPAQVASAFCFAMGIAGVARLAGLLAGDSRAAWAAGLALAGDAWVGRWLWSGMETGLAVALVAWALALRVNALRGSRQDRVSGLLIALAPLVRPELVVFALAALLVELPAIRRGEWKRPGWDLLMLGVVGGSWVLFALLTWGSVLPSTAVAKGSLGAGNITTISAAVRVLAVIASTQAFAAVAVLLALWRWGREAEGNSERVPGRRDLVRWVGLFALMMVGLYAGRHVNVYTRYVLPLSAALVAVAFAYVVSLSSGPGRWRSGRRREWVWGAVLALTLAGNLVLSSRLVVPKTRDYAHSMEEVVLPLARTLGEITKDDDVVAAPNIGAIGFYSGRRILDLNGLVTPEILPYKREGRILEYLEQKRPEIIVEIEPTPRSLVSRSGRLRTEEIGVYRFEGMFVRGPNPMYLSVYRVLPP